MATKKTIEIKPSGDDSFTLSSSWKCTATYNREKQQYINVLDSGTPTTGKAEKKFKYSLPSGAKIKKSRIYAKLGSPLSGCSIRTANGNTFSHKDGDKNGADVKLSGTSGTLTVEFKFKANGSTSDTKSHTSKLSFSDVRLKIEYTGEDDAKEPEKNKKKKKKYYTPPQTVCIYDKDSEKVYMFDGVAKIQHSLTMDVQEEPDSNKKKEFVNNARNQPDKLTIDVMMSDVYTSNPGNSMTKYSGKFVENQLEALEASKDHRVSDMDNSRSLQAFHVLHQMKEDRKKLIIVTAQYVYLDMLLTTVTVNQDENTPFGWEGQIVFQKAFETVKKGNSNSGKVDGGISVPSPSIAASWGVHI